MICSKIKVLRAESIWDLVVELVKAKPRNANMDWIISFPKDILRCLENEENEECETNQSSIGMKELFQGCAVVAQEWINISSDKCRVLSPIIAK